MNRKGYSKHFIPEEMVLKWQQTVDIMAQVFDVPAALIMRVSSSEIEVLVTSKTDNNPYEASASESLGTGLYCETVMADRDILHVPDALADDDWKDNPDVELDMIMYLGVPLLWPDGDIFGTVCVLDSKTRKFTQAYTDIIWEFKKIIESDCRSYVYQQELIEAKERADAANRAKGVFLASMSHEFRTPLNAIMGFAQIMQKESDKQFISDAAKTILESGRHLLALINDVLDMSKIDAGKFGLYPEEFRPVNMVKNIINIIKPKADSKNIDLRYCQVTPFPWIIKGDRKRLRQVLINLLGNAVKFTVEGEVQLTVWYAGTDNESGKGRFFFSVKDSGIGIAPEDFDRIMEPFEQVKGDEQYREGTGLGLPVSKRIIELMEGTLEIESEVGKGAHFWFEVMLPVINGGLDDDFGNESVLTGYEGENRKILWFKRRSSFSDPVEYLLKLAGFRVVDTEDAEVVLETIRSGDVDAVIVDKSRMCDFSREVAEVSIDIPVIPFSIWFCREEKTPLTGRIWSNKTFVKPENLISVITEKLGIEIPATHVVINKSENSRTFVYPEKKDLNCLKKLADYYRYDELEDVLLDIENRNVKCGKFIAEVRTLASRFRMGDIIKLIEDGINENHG